MASSRLRFYLIPVLREVCFLKCLLSYYRLCSARIDAHLNWPQVSLSVQYLVVEVGQPYMEDSYSCDHDEAASAAYSGTPLIRSPTGQNKVVVLLG